jgi:mono/diheme cytochrome c family protein
MRLLPVFSLLLAGLAAGMAAISQPQTEPRIVPGPISKAASEARSWKNPYEGRTDAIQAGEKLFRQHCAECHGDDGRGIGKAADLHSPVVQAATGGELVWFLRNGNLAKGMPSWSGLPIERRWQIVTYLKSLPSGSD